MRVLSPKILPPVRSAGGIDCEDGYILLEVADEMMPRASMTLLLPVPGDPVMPKRMELPVEERQSSTICSGKIAVSGARAFNEGDGLGEDGAIALRMPSTYWRRERTRRRAEIFRAGSGSSGTGQPGRT